MFPDATYKAWLAKKNYGPDATFSYRSQRTRLAGENFVSLLVRYAVTPQKSLPLVL